MWRRHRRRGGRGECGSVGGIENEEEGAEAIGDAEEGLVALVVMRRVRRRGQGGGCDSVVNAGDFDRLWRRQW